MFWGWSPHLRPPGSPLGLNLYFSNWKELSLLRKVLSHPFWVPYSCGGQYSLALHWFREEHSWDRLPACCLDCWTPPLAPEFPANVLLPFVSHPTGSPKPCFLWLQWLGTMICLCASPHPLRNKCWHRIKCARISLGDTPEWKELGWEMEKAERPFWSWCIVTYSEREKGRRWKLLVCPSVLRRIQKAVVRAYQPESPIKGVLGISLVSPHLFSGRVAAYGRRTSAWTPRLILDCSSLAPWSAYAPHSHRSARCMLMAFTTCQAALSSSTCSWACSPGASLALQAGSSTSRSQYLPACSIQRESTASQAMPCHQ